MNFMTQNSLSGSYAADTDLALARANTITDNFLENYGSKSWVNPIDLIGQDSLQKATRLVELSQTDSSARKHKIKLAEDSFKRVIGRSQTFFGRLFKVQPNTDVLPEFLKDLEAVAVLSKTSALIRRRDLGVALSELYTDVKTVEILLERLDGEHRRKALQRLNLLDEQSIVTRHALASLKLVSRYAARIEAVVKESRKRQEVLDDLQDIVELLHLQKESEQ